MFASAQPHALRFARRAVAVARPQRARLHDREFWIAQGLMAAATVVLYTSHVFAGDAFGGGLHDIPIMFYLAPVIYATVVYGFEGAVLTSTWAILLAIPHCIIYSAQDFEWLGDMGSLTIIIVTSIALAIRVERERDERERAERASERLTLLNDVGLALAPARSVGHLLQELVSQLQRGFRLDSVGAVSFEPSDTDEPIVAWSNGKNGANPPRSTVSSLVRMTQADAQPPELDGWLLAPMSAGARSLGVVAAKRTAVPLSVQEQEVLRTAARQASVALDNLRLESEHRQRLRSYARQVTNAQEEEQRRIARELHDGVAQALSGLCRGLDLLRAELRTGQADPDATAGSLRTVAEEALRDIRRVTRDLRPTILDDLGLLAGVEWLASDLVARTAIAVQFGASAVPKNFSAEQELTIFRVAQETLKNVEKHSGATQVDVSLTSTQSVLHMQIADNGCGFVVPADGNELAIRGAYGLLGMRERAELNGGSIAIESGSNRGTTVTLTMPPTGDARTPREAIAAAIS